MSSINKIFIFFIIFKILFVNNAFIVNAEESFDVWLSSYKKFALKNDISQETIDIAFKNVKFLDQVIKYDRKQPEFFEDTNTYVTKRANKLRANKAKNLLKKNMMIILEFVLLDIQRNILRLQTCSLIFIF